MSELIYQGAHIDGRTLVVIRRTWLGYEAVESGRLLFDGVGLCLENENGQRVVGDQEIDTLKLVTAENEIQPCRGFDLFRILDDHFPHDPCP